MVIPVTLHQVVESGLLGDDPKLVKTAPAGEKPED
jgi:hypothetical protein